MPNIATVEPTRLSQGDTVTWIKEVADYVAPTWTLSYELRGPASITVTAADNGDGRHLVTVAKGVTATWNAGTYWWEAYVTDGTSRYRVGYGLMEVGKDFAKGDAVFDGRTHAARALAACEAAIEQLLKANVQAYSTGGNQVQKIIPRELRDMRTAYLAEVRQERARERQRRGLNAGTGVRVIL